MGSMIDDGWYLAIFMLGACIGIGIAAGAIYGLIILNEKISHWRDIRKWRRIYNQ